MRWSAVSETEIINTDLQPPNITLKLRAREDSLNEHAEDSIKATYINILLLKVMSTSHPLVWMAGGKNATLELGANKAAFAPAVSDSIAAAVNIKGMSLHPFRVCALNLSVH